MPIVHHILPVMAAIALFVSFSFAFLKLLDINFIVSH